MTIMAKFFVAFFRGIRNRKAGKWVKEGDRVLDIGCGAENWLLKSVEGRISRGVGIDEKVEQGNSQEDRKNGVTGHRLTGKKQRFQTDNDEKFPEENKSSKISCFPMTVKKKLPFKDKEFDAVTMIAFIEHIEHPKEVTKECFRVLKKGGRLIITTPMKRARRGWELLVKAGFTDEEGIENHVHYYTPEELRTLLKDTGFSVEFDSKFELGMNYIVVGKK